MESYSSEDRHWLLTSAREAITARLEQRAPAFQPAPPGSVAASQKRGAFISLHIGRQLRGCIGQLEANDFLINSVRSMAVAAAFEDPRFPALSIKELTRCNIEISVLSELRPTVAEDIVVGRDGVLLRFAGRSAVFLPQVPSEQGWDRTTYLEQLCRKAGLATDSYLKAGAHLQIFTAEVFSD